MLQFDIWPEIPQANHVQAELENSPYRKEIWAMRINIRAQAMNQRRKLPDSETLI